VIREPMDLTRGKAYYSCGNSDNKDVETVAGDVW